MSSSTSLLDLISQSQGSKELTANALFNAASPATLFGRRDNGCLGLVWAYYGGLIVVDGVATSIANGTLTLTASSGVNYIETTRAGVVSKNTTGFTPGSIPLYSATAGASTIMPWTDYRLQAEMPGVAGKLSRVMSADANITLTQPEASNQILQITSSVSLAATRNVVVPLQPQQWTVYNGTSGAQSLQFIGASGTGITVANGKRAILYADGTNVVRVTADV